MDSPPPYPIPPPAPLRTASAWGGVGQEHARMYCPGCLHLYVPAKYPPSSGSAMGPNVDHTINNLPKAEVVQMHPG